MTGRLKLVLGGTMVAVALLIGAAWLYGARQRGEAATAEGVPAVRLAVTTSACEPSEITVPAGKVSFLIENRSAHALEWEILKGVMVVDERENIAPGFTQRLTTTLDPGDYEMACGLLSNPRGRLRVTAAEGARGSAAVSLIDLIGPIAEYKVHLAGEAAALSEAVRALSEATAQGDGAAARTQIAAARMHYERLRPALPLLGDLGQRIDPGPGGAAPERSGLGGIQARLAAPDALRDVAPALQRLTADVAELRERVGTLTVMPGQMVAGATGSLAMLTSSEAVDAAAAGGAASAAGKVAELLLPVLSKADPGLAAKIAADRSVLDAALPERVGAGQGGDALALRDAAGALADDLERAAKLLAAG